MIEYPKKNKISTCVDLRERGSVYPKIFWTRLWSPISISWPLGQEIEKLEIGLVQKIFGYTDPLPLRSTIHIGKVRTFWEAHKIWKNLPYGFDVYYIDEQRCFSNFVCFSESLNIRNKQSVTFTTQIGTLQLVSNNNKLNS